MELIEALNIILKDLKDNYLITINHRISCLNHMSKYDQGYIYYRRVFK
jgi:hypothetical protein